MNYILKNKIPVLEPNILKWAKWAEANWYKRVVAQDYIGNYEVSTIFLGIDHNFWDNNKPLLFETMIFPECDYCERCATWDEALEQHKRAIESLKI